MAEILIQRLDTRDVVPARPGDTLVIELQENLSTGYAWQIASQPPWCQLIDSTHTPAATGLMGAPGTHRFRMSVSDVGVGAIELTFRRAWEPPEAEVDHVSIQVNAR